MAGPGIVVGVLFLFFGVGLIGFVLSETPASDEPGLMIVLLGFGVIWVVACGAIILAYARIRRHRAGVSPDSLLHIETAADGGNDADADSDFEARLRKVERLYRDGLLSEAEYGRKRDEILNEKW